MCLPAPTTGRATPVVTTQPPSLVDSFTATLDHRFDDAFSVRNISRYSTYALDRFNTLPGGTTDPVTLTVGRTRSFILRDESSWFNQTDLTYKNALGGFKQEWLHRKVH